MSFEQRSIIRVEGGDISLLPENLKKNIEKEIGKNFSIENLELPLHEEYAKAYISRLEAIHAGINFLLDALHISEKEMIKTDAAYKLNFYKKQLENLKDQEKNNIVLYQNILAAYKEAVLNLLKQNIDKTEKELVYYLGKAEEFALAQKPRPVLYTVVKIDSQLDDYAVIIDKSLNPFSRELIKDLHNIKNDMNTHKISWFSMLDEVEKKLIKSFLDASEFDLNDEKILAKMAFSSKLRLMPVNSNYGYSEILFYSGEKKEIIFKEQENRSSHIGSRDMKLKELREIHAVYNLRQQVRQAIKKILNELKSREFPEDVKEFCLPVLLQTLITPLRSPDKELYEDKKIAIDIIQKELDNAAKRGEFCVNGVEIKFEILSTNHPLNVGRIICHTHSKSTTTAPAIRRIIQLAKEAMDKKIVSKEDEKFLSQALERLQIMALEEDGLQARFSDSRELHLSALEQMSVSRCGGVAIGSCISGKDRKAVELMYTHAMRIYYEKYKTLYLLDDTNLNKTRFGAIFSKLYLSNHYQKHAGLNAPGVEGIQTPWKYIPSYLQEAIRRENARQNKGYRDDFQTSHQLACNNEFKKIESNTKFAEPRHEASISVSVFPKKASENSLLRLLWQSLCKALFPESLKEKELSLSPIDLPPVVSPAPPPMVKCSA